MLLKKKNTLVGVINLSFGVLSCICYFICINYIKKVEHFYIASTEFQDILATIFAIIMLLPLAFTCIINLIYIFRNWKKKKSMFMNILALIAIIASFLLSYVLESISFLYIVSIVALSGILLLIFNKTEEEDKKHRIMFGIMIINITFLIISSIGFIYLKSNYKITYANNEKNMLKSIMQTSTNANVKLIKAKKNGKYGYIDTNGNTVIDFIFDDCSDFISFDILNTNERYYIAEVSIGNEVRLITNNNDQICICKNTQSNGKINVNYISNQFLSAIKKNAKELKLNIRINDNNTLKALKYEERYNYNIVYSEYESDNSFSFRIPLDETTTRELSYNSIAKTAIYNNKNITLNGKIGVYSNDSTYPYLYCYKNGFIPIYNFEKAIFGWIDLNGDAHYINGKKQILDFSNKYIALKDYSIASNLKTYLIDYSGKRVSDFYQEIKVLDKGYIVKKENGKNVYCDDNLKQLTEEYDIIDVSRISDNLIIVSNNNDSYNIRFSLINTNNGQIIGENFEYISGMYDYKYMINNHSNVSYYDNYKKNYDTILYENMNTELYTTFYN